MKVALPIWNHRISPVFDTARKVVVVDVENHQENDRIEHQLNNAGFIHRTESLQEMGVSVLICGAISRALEIELTSRGIEVISQICGDVEKILGAYLNEEIDQERFLMPGCSHKQRCRRRHQKDHFVVKGTIK